MTKTKTVSMLPRGATGTNSLYGCKCVCVSAHKTCETRNANVGKEWDQTKKKEDGFIGDTIESADYVKK